MNNLDFIAPEFDVVCFDCDQCNWKCIDYIDGDFYIFTYECTHCKRIQKLEIDLEK